MVNPAEWLWLAPIGILIGGVLLGLSGYRGRRQSGESSTIRGAAIVDSAVGNELVYEVKRLADTAEAIREILQHDSNEAEIDRRAEKRAADLAEREKRKGGESKG